MSFYVTLLVGGEHELYKPLDNLVRHEPTSISKVPYFFSQRRTASSLLTQRLAHVKVQEAVGF
jgi:hypothetical protein